ncbi:MAG: NnrU protein, partial [Gammaproteobacteria bacterium]|nr:NnrU protein [Gammaproteobacteria bacterium]
MIEILIASLLWVVTHLAVSSTLLRPALVKRVGERTYLAGYILVAAASLGYLIWVYTDVPRVDYWWEPNIGLYWPAKLLLPLACIFLVGGFMVKNPTIVGMTLTESEAHNLAKGVTRITRHPFQWAVIVWGVT